MGIEKVPGTGEELGRAEIVGRAKATKEVGDAVVGARLLVGVHEIATDIATDIKSAGPRFIMW